MGAACDDVIANLWDEVENDPDGEDGKPILQEYTYTLQENASRVEHYSEKDIDVSDVETWASKNFDSFKAAMQVIKGDTRSVCVSGQESGSDDEQLGALLTTNMVIKALSPPPQAPTAVGAPVCFDRNVPTGAH